MAFAKQEFKGLTKVGPALLSDHMAAAEKQLGRKIAVPGQNNREIKLEPPYQLAHVWFWFLEIRPNAGGGGFGPTRLSFVDVLAWARLTMTFPRPWEIKLLLQIDGLFLEQKIADGRRNQDGKS